jgi:hypothetical protein
MTSGQRKVHKFTWILMAIIIPVLIFFSIKNLDFSETKESTILVKQTSKKDAIKIAENEQIKASLFENSIEVIVKSTLKTSSTVVYAINENGEKGNPLGQVSTVGIYAFSTTNSIKGIVIFDEIKQTEITKLRF